MAKVKLTAGRIERFHCPEDKEQSFLWCDETPGLGVRATAGSDRKRYIFQAKVNGKSMRVTIGDVSVWSIAKAQAEARRLQVLIDQGHDPRQVEAAREAANKVKAAALERQKLRETVTLGMAWEEYLAARKPQWSERHYRDHIADMHPGGEKRIRSKVPLTIPGPLASLAPVRLVGVTPELVEEWAQAQSAQRPTRARLSLRLLKAFLFWCSRHPTYKAIVTDNAAQSKTARESLGKPSVKNDALQREQLAVWFAAVKQIDNPVTSAYLQALLLTGARRNELATLRWEEVDFQWNSLTIRDKVEGTRIIPLTPYVRHLLGSLPRRNGWVFSSPMAESGRLVDPRIAHNKACAVAGLEMTLHGLRRSFASLCEWIEMPAGIAAQIQGHKPQGVREQNYIRRPLDLLRMWHVKIEAWILEQAGIEFIAEKPGLQVVRNT
ncbi:tyrosine-type recombinase/integrase [Nitrosospira multiformis]|uniref:Phage integrase family protein n=1 Tax=Nitrosospira multiformis TaxID=1231 RepID=A0A1I7IXM8_9PROT|nr:integrase family protein [Nitrosospira multiformis]SFU77659.1 Phage integrase family protein [Nitrosospira multiformis]